MWQTKEDLAQNVEKEKTAFGFILWSRTVVVVYYHTRLQRRILGPIPPGIMAKSEIFFTKMNLPFHLSPCHQPKVSSSLSCRCFEQLFAHSEEYVVETQDILRYKDYQESLPH